MVVFGVRLGGVRRTLALCAVSGKSFSTSPQAFAFQWGRKNHPKPIETSPPSSSSSTPSSSSSSLGSKKTIKEKNDLPEDYFEEPRSTMSFPTKTSSSKTTSPPWFQKNQKSSPSSSSSSFKTSPKPPPELKKERRAIQSKTKPTIASPSFSQTGPFFFLFFFL